MEICSVCHSKSMIPERYGRLVLCKKCAFKLQTSKWKDKTYSNNSEVDSQRDWVVSKARYYTEEDYVISSINEYFDSFIIEGLYKKIDGNRGQVITVFDDHCTIETSANFDYKERNKTFRRIITGRRGVASGIADYVSPEMASTVISGVVGSVLPGGGLIKKSLRQVGKTMAVNALSGNTSSYNTESINGITSLPVNPSVATLYYDNYDNIQFYAPVGEEDCGFVLIWGGNSAQNYSFAFSSSKEVVESVYDATEFIQKQILQLKQQAEERISNVDAMTPPPLPTSVVPSAEELLKYKDLLDMGVITEEEFSALKRKILGL